LSMSCMTVFLWLVQAGGVEPPATRLSAEALAVRTGLRNSDQ
jgi:hypothetical protein